MWYVKECELHPESHGKQRKDLKWGNGLIGSDFLANTSGSKGKGELFGAD